MCRVRGPGSRKASGTCRKPGRVGELVFLHGDHSAAVSSWYRP